MCRPTRFVAINLAFILGASCGFGSQGSVQANDAANLEFFEKKIRPVLVEHCYQCHSGESNAVKGGLRVDFREALLAGGDSGAAIESGDNDSLLLEAIRYEGLEMPPKGKLPPAVIRDFEQWVKLGAPDPRQKPDDAETTRPSIDFAKAADFWAFQSIQKPTPPLNDSETPATAIDQFVAAKLSEHGLRLSPRANRRTLIRRAYFDLIGLPPTPAQVTAFLDDKQPGAFDRLVESLLESPHYGERWGRRWLDVARYGEDQAHTFKARRYPRGYLYRDWVVDAFNQDMPYDQFLKWQIAGDLLPGGNAHERRAALGLFALGPVYYAENVEKAKAAADEWDDRIDTLTRGVLGLTVACARCHDHKFDPISMDDYYGLAGIFSNSKYEERPVVSDDVVAHRREADEEVKQQVLEINRFLQGQSQAIRPQLTGDIPGYFQAAWRVIHANKNGEKNTKKLIASAVAKSRSPAGGKLSPELVDRWVKHLTAATKRQPQWSDLERVATRRWKEFASSGAAVDDESLAAAGDIGLEFQRLVEQKLPRREQLLTVYGADVAFVRQEDRAETAPGVFPLGNLFDDSASVSLAAAMRTDRYTADASASDLGVDRVLQGWGDRANIAADIQFDFRKLGSSQHSYGAIVNDGWQKSGALSTTGKRTADKGRREQGIGMHANALITFDLNEIRRAGLLPDDQTFRFVIDRAGVNDDALGAGSSAHIACLVTRRAQDKAVTDAVISAHVNGRKVEIDVDDFTYYIAGDVGEPLRADGKHVQFDIQIPADADFITLVTTGANDPADNPISSDHTVLSGARLQLEPLPKSDGSPRTETEVASRNEADRQDAMLMSRLFYDEGLLALPAAEVESRLSADAKTTLQAMKKQQESLQRVAEEIQVLTAHSLVDNGDQGKDLPIYIQGNPAKHGDLAPRGTPAIFTQGKKRPFAGRGSGRLQLAESLASADNPLTARVIANRIWAGHFGVGIVKTTSNFGQLGDRPTHPQLLDWLASSLIESGWSIKSLHRQIMTSQVYQQSSESRANAREMDAENRLLWRTNRRRLEVEPWRDGLLAVSGELDPVIGGTSMDLDKSDNRRRTIYGFVSRHRLNELLRLFDFPDPNITSADRAVTTVPLQQLFVMNSDFMAERAKAFVKRIDALELADDQSRIEQAYQFVYGRSPSPRETMVGMTFIQKQPVPDDQLSRWEQFSLALLSSNEFMFVD